MAFLLICLICFYSCSICDRNFLDGVSLQEHTKRLHSPDDDNCDRMFQCEMCDRRFLQRCQMRYHQRKEHMRDEDKKFECYQCRKRYSTILL